MRKRSTLVRLLAVASAGLALLGVAQVPAQANGQPQASLPTALPSNFTPDVNDGTVYAITQVGSKIILGGLFTNATSKGSSTAVTRNDILAFDPTTGLVDDSFVPALDGEVDALIPGPVPNTVYAAGRFKTVNGKNMRLALLDTNTGATVAGWKPAVFSAGTLTLAKFGNTLYVGGLFAKVGGFDHIGLVALDANTGALQPWLQVDMAGHHGTGSAVGGIGPQKIELDATGTRMIVIGNFTSVTDAVTTYARDQVMILNVAQGTSATVDPNWKTLAYSAQCFNNAFDSYVRDVQISPDNTYFVLVATGGSGTNTDGTKSSCDSASRYEMSSSGSNVRPTWIDYTGQDSLWSVAVTGTAVYAGGHQRWMNNYNGRDSAGAGAVPRPGLVAMDPQNGLPLAWNPGRQPRGAGAFALFASADGLYVGSDTEWIGNFQWHRNRIAYFPLAGGYVPASKTIGTLPGTVYQAGQYTNQHPEVLYRVDAGGPTVAATDNGPDWAADQTDPSPYRNTGSLTATYSPSASLDSTIPAGTPTALFDTERYDPAGGNEMQWALPVPSGVTVTVQLYFANRCSCTSHPNQRRFNVDLEGVRRLTNFDIVAATGNNRATMRSWSVVSDGAINVNFGHVTDNPLVNGIQIIQTNPPVPPPANTSALKSRTIDVANNAGPVTTVDTATMDWSTVRGAFQAGGTLFYAKTDGTFDKRSFDGSTFGPEVLVEPYLDAYWLNVQTGSGTNQVYNGVHPNNYSKFSSLSSMFYTNNSVFYTYTGDTKMYTRPFLPDSGIFGPVESTVTDGLSWSGIAGAFVSGNTLYYVTKSDGVLRSYAWNGSMATGASSVVNGDGLWAARSLFLLSRVNKLPVPSFTWSCTPGNLSCTFNGSASNDPDGSITGYSWSFGDGGTDTSGATPPTHVYPSAGTRTVSLTVTDSDGATATTTQQVTATNTAPTAALTVTCPPSSLTCTVDASGSGDPDGTISTYAFDFGDGQSQSGPDAVVPHTYASPGLDTVKVTVTDNVGATATATASANPSVPHQNIGFDGAASFTKSGTSTGTVTVPSTVQTGDVMVLFQSISSTSLTATDPAGWTPIATKSSGSGILTTAYTKVATASDAGSPVTVSWSGSGKVTMSVAAYSGVSPSAPVGAFATAVDGSSSSHTTPTVTVPQVDSWVISYWTDKSTTAPTFWTSPGDVTVRATQLGGNTGSLSGLLADTGGPVAAGSYGGKTASVSSTDSTRGLSWTVSLTPAS
ncbi:MAG: PKD domain-containing protein [Actinomycetales bacterium]